MSKLEFFKLRQQDLAQFTQEVENGDRDALTAYANIKKLESEIIAVKKQIEPLALDEAVAFGEKSFETHGIKFEVRNGATRYSYKGIPEWVEKQKELKAIEDKSKHAFISVQKGLLTVTDDIKEIPMPEVSYSKNSLIVK